jgi:hypothetical protein
MSPSLDVLLPHYRRELDEAIVRLAPAGAPSCPPGEALLWAEAGEADGWLTSEQAMELRRLAGRLRFYESRALSTQHPAPST